VADREYRILVSYALSRNSGAVFQDVEASSARARAKIEGDSKASAALLMRNAKQAADAAVRESAATAKAAERDAKQIVAAAEKAATQKAAAAERAAKAEERAAQQSAKAQERAYEYVYRLKQKFLEKEERDAEQAAKRSAARASRAEKTAGRDRERTVGGFASDAFSGIKGTASRAMGVGSSIASGMGVKLDLGQQIAASGDFKRTIVDVTNAGLGIQGKLAGKGDYASTTKAVEGAADHTKIGQNKIAEGLSVFVDKASDIEAGKAMLNSLGDIAQASGTDFVELAGSAGEFFKMMSGSGPEKIKNVEKLLALAAKQGQVGNLAFKELAPTIGKLAAQGQKIKGDYTENVGQLMALSQVSLQGGATKGAEANRAAQAFVMDQTKGSSLKTFKKYGVKVFEDQDEKGGGTVLRNQHELIRELFSKNAGKLNVITDEFKGQKSGNVITGFANIFRDAGGTGGKKGDVEKGLAAIDATFKKFTEPMSQAEIKNSSGAVKEGSGAKAEAFNNQLERIAGSLSDRVLPQMEKLGPKVLELVEAFSSVVSWAAENPGAAITAAIVGSITRAAIGSVVSSTLSGLLTGSIKYSGVGGLGGLGGLGSAMAITAAAATIYIAGTAIIDKLSDKTSQGQNKSVNEDASLLNALSKARHARETGQGIPEAMAELEKVKELQSQRIKGAENVTGLGEALNPLSDKSLADRAAESNDAAHMEQLSADMKAVVAAIKSLKDGVRVTNMPAGGPVPPAGGRVGVPGHGGGP
jgi:hypothetical protein